MATVVFVVWVKVLEPMWSPIPVDPDRKPFSWASQRYLLPFIMLIVLLMLVSAVPELKEALKGRNTPAESVLNLRIMHVATSCQNFIRRWGWLAHSGMQVVLCALCTPLLVPYVGHLNPELLNVVELQHESVGGPRELEKEQISHKELQHESVGGPRELEKEQISHKELQHESVGGPRELEKEQISHKATRIKGQNTKTEKALHHMRDNLESFWQRYTHVISVAFWDAVWESIPVMVAIASYASIANIMTGFAMTQTIALSMVSIFRDAPEGFTPFMAVIGMIGSGLTGSTTTSNFLFARLQLQSALDLGLVTASGKGSAWAVGGAQILGSTAGEAISPMNSVFSAILLGGRVSDADIIREVLPLGLVWTLLCMVTTWVAVSYL